MSEQRYIIRWRGKEHSPLTKEDIRQKLDDREFGLLHEIYSEDSWITLREFFEAESVRLAEAQAREEAAQRLEREQEAQRQKEEDVLRQEAAIAEERRKNDLLAAALEKQNGGKSQSSPGESKSSGMRTVGSLLVFVALLTGGYYFAFFDQTVATSGGDRINNIGLMQDRQIGIMVSIGLLIAGTIMMLLSGKSAKQ